MRAKQSALMFPVPAVLEKDRDGNLQTWPAYGIFSKSFCNERLSVLTAATMLDSRQEIKAGIIVWQSPPTLTDTGPQYGPYIAMKCKTLQQENGNSSTTNLKNQSHKKQH